ncbi:MAG: MBL fold metallo-hydrolase [Victivallales bacterium]
MTVLDVMAIGILERDPNGKVTKADSTCTLVRTSEKTILVDTSTEYLWPMIEISFEQIGLRLKDVDTVVLTHMHRDHTENLNKFTDAKIYVHEGEKSNIPGAISVTGDEYRLDPDVLLVHTPGHTKGSMSVFVDADLKYAIAGDAIPTKNNLLKMTPPASNYDEELALESIKKIKGYADIVIPGHGSPFPTRI